MSEAERYAMDTGPMSPAASGEVVVTGTEFAVVCKALWIGKTGDVSALMADRTTTLVFKNVPIGWLDIRCIKVTTANTSADNMVAVY